jgi:hypothetical protein
MISRKLIAQGQHTIGGPPPLPCWQLYARERAADATVNGVNTHNQH